VDIDETISITDYASRCRGSERTAQALPPPRETTRALARASNWSSHLSPAMASGETRHWSTKRVPRGKVHTLECSSCTGRLFKKGGGTMRHAWPTADRIGDRPTDCEAYVANGMLALVVNPRRGVAYNPIAIFLKDWHAIEAFFQVTRKSARSGGPRRGIQGGAAAARPRHRAHRAEVDVYVFFRASFL